ncbi:MAG: DUF1801 domain-containing protein [Dehalococcoidia bacterium]|nr:DUF1801 domain-containing protein [Dehalococcoidia bacterium]
MGSGGSDVDAYMEALAPEPRATLERIREAVRAAAPEAVERISYGMPTFTYRGRPLIHFAAAKAHCAIYGTSAGTLRFGHAEPPDDAFVRGLVVERMAAIEAQLAAKPGRARAAD